MHENLYEKPKERSGEQLESPPMSDSYFNPAIRQIASFKSKRSTNDQLNHSTREVYSGNEKNRTIMRSNIADALLTSLSTLSAESKSSDQNDRYKRGQSVLSLSSKDLEEYQMNRKKLRENEGTGSIFSLLTEEQKIKIEKNRCSALLKNPSFMERKKQLDMKTPCSFQELSIGTRVSGWKVTGQVFDVRSDKGRHDVFLRDIKNPNSTLRAFGFKDPNLEEKFKRLTAIKIGRCYDLSNFKINPKFRFLKLETTCTIDLQLNRNSMFNENLDSFKLDHLPNQPMVVENFSRVEFNSATGLNPSRVFECIENGTDVGVKDSELWKGEFMSGQVVNVNTSVSSYSIGTKKVKGPVFMFMLKSELIRVKILMPISAFNDNQELFKKFFDWLKENQNGPVFLVANLIFKETAKSEKAKNSAHIITPETVMQIQSFNCAQSVSTSFRFKVGQNSTALTTSLKRSVSQNYEIEKKKQHLTWRNLQEVSLETPVNSMAVENFFTNSRSTVNLQSAGYDWSTSRNAATNTAPTPVKFDLDLNSKLEQQQVENAQSNCQLVQEEFREMRLPDGFEPFNEIDASGSCLYDSWSVLLADGRDHRALRRMANDYIANYYQNFLNGKVPLIDNSVPGDVLSNGLRFKFTQQGYINYHNEPSIYGELPQMMALSNLTQSPVHIYMPHENDTGYRVHVLNEQFSGPIRQFLLAGQHYRPLVQQQFNDSQVTEVMESSEVFDFNSGVQNEQKSFTASVLAYVKQNLTPEAKKKATIAPIEHENCGYETSTNGVKLQDDLFQKSIEDNEQLGSEDQKSSVYRLATPCGCKVETKAKDTKSQNVRINDHFGGDHAAFFTNQPIFLNNDFYHMTNEKGCDFEKANRNRLQDDERKKNQSIERLQQYKNRCLINNSLQRNEEFIKFVNKRKKSSKSERIKEFWSVRNFVFSGTYEDNYKLDDLNETGWSIQHTEIIKKFEKIGLLYVGERVKANNNQTIGTRLYLYLDKNKLKSVDSFKKFLSSINNIGKEQVDERGDCSRREKRILKDDIRVICIDGLNNDAGSMGEMLMIKTVGVKNLKDNKNQGEGFSHIEFDINDLLDLAAALLYRAYDLFQKSIETSSVENKFV